MSYATRPSTPPGFDPDLHPEVRERTARWLLLAYKRAVSPVLHALVVTHCNYLPTCSEYAYVAVVRHGWIRGSWLALRRLGRCHPFARGGADPVP